MPCRSITFPGGGAIICSRGARRETCQVPQCGHQHTKLCDFPISHFSRCDVRLCSTHAHNVGPDKDYCPAHFKISQEKDNA